MDGMHRFEILGKLGKETKYEVRFFLDKQSEKKFVVEVNLKRRHLNDFQKAEMGMVLLEVEEQIRGQGRRTDLAPNGAKLEKGKSTEIVSKKIGLSRNTFERAKKVIEEAPEEIKDLCRKQVLPIYPAYGVVKAFGTVPDKSKKTLTEQLVKGQMEPHEVIRTIASTNAVKAQLEGEEETVKEKAEELFKDKFYTKELNSKEAIWQIEEIAGDPHKLITREFPLETFVTFEEAQAWAVKREGVCLGKVEKWSIKYDPVKDKKLNEAKENESKDE